MTPNYPRSPRSGRRNCFAHYLLAATPEIRPVPKTDPESVTEVTKWLDSHTKPAGNGHSPTLPLNGNTFK